MKQSDGHMKYRSFSRLDLPAIDKEVRQFWEDANIFEKSIGDEREETFVFFEGPPSANGLPGVHHVLARAIKDIFPRYKTMKGFQVKRKAGWESLPPLHYLAHWQKCW